MRESGRRRGGGGGRVVRVVLAGSGQAEPWPAPRIAGAAGESCAAARVRASRPSRAGPGGTGGRPTHLIPLAELQPQGDEVLHPDEAVRILVAHVENLLELPQEPQQARRLHRGH